MAGFMILTWVREGSVWTNPNLIAVMWLGPGVADGRFGSPTLIGFATHMTTSVLMGLVGVLFIGLLHAGERFSPPWPTH
jgi:hypothetical protein